MVQKSKGPRRRTRNLLRRKAREKTPITKYLQEFEMGSKVVINPTPSSHKGMPFKRFFGKTGTIIDRRGKSYIVKIKNGKKEKELIARSEHLKAI
ncbi:MAG: 50S ribosomal protein L21e [Candidatus Aenigmarchaeota archaeon]|nr:50S ribosomal protein L21e [Candidatus Aenigmarchaeota archaeon]